MCAPYTDSTLLKGLWSALTLNVAAPSLRVLCCPVLSWRQVREIGGRKVTVFVQEAEDSRVASVILRASTTNVLDDLERAVDDGESSLGCLG